MAKVKGVITMENKRYYLVSYCGTREKKIETYLEYNKLLEKVRDYSSKNLRLFSLSPMVLDCLRKARKKSMKNFK